MSSVARFELPVSKTTVAKVTFQSRGPRRWDDLELTQKELKQLIAFLEGQLIFYPTGQGKKPKEIRGDEL